MDTTIPAGNFFVLKKLCGILLNCVYNVVYELQLLLGFSLFVAQGWLFTSVYDKDAQGHIDFNDIGPLIECVMKLSKYCCSVDEVEWLSLPRRTSKAHTSGVTIEALCILCSWQACAIG